MRAEYMLNLAEAISRKDYLAMGAVLAAAGSEEIRLGRKKNGYALLDAAQVIRRIPHDFEAYHAEPSQLIRDLMQAAQPYEDE